MAETVKLTIDGKTLEAEKGMNLIDAAELAGVHIPNLCYLKGMAGIGACRLCLVEVEGSKAPLIACNTKVKDGMVVTTNTDKIRETRRFVIDLILSMHPLDCMTCTKAGVCNLQQYAYDFELKESTFTRKKFGYPVDEANPFIKRDPEYCILCGRCVRICRAQGTNVLDFNGRGVGARVITANDKPLQDSTCTFCGSCVDVCPVNALLEADRWRKGREWDYERSGSVCLICGNACSITVSTKDGEVVKINNGAPEGDAERFICAYGRFSFDSMYSDIRVSVPMKRVQGELRETTWEDAVSTVAERLKSAGSSASIVSSAAIMNEDALLLKKLAEEVVKTKNVDSSVSLYADYDVMKGGEADLGGADLFVLAGVAPDQWKRIHPALDALIRKKVQAGARVIVINEKDTRIADSASVVLRGDEVKLLEEMAQAYIAAGNKAPKEMVEALAHVNPSDDAVNAAKLFQDAKAPVVLSSAALFRAAANLSLLKGGAVPVPIEANARGVVLMGLTSSGQKFGEIVASRSKALYVIGDVPVESRPQTDFLVVQTSHMTDLATHADVILPAAITLESGGTVIDYLGRLRTLNKACEPRGSARPHSEIFMAIAKEMGGSLKAVKDTDIKKALKAKTKIAFSPFKKGKTAEIDDEAFLESVIRAKVNGSRLLWLKELERVVTA